MKSIGLLILLACVLMPNNINSQLINLSNQLFHSYIPIYYATVNDVSAGFIQKSTENSLYDCEKTCSLFVGCKMISFNPASSNECTLYKNVVTTSAFALASPLVYQQQNPLEFSTTKSYLLGFWPFNGNGNDVTGKNSFTSIQGSFVQDRFNRASSALYACGPLASLSSASITITSDFTISAWVYLNSYYIGTINRDDIGVLLRLIRYPGLTVIKAKLASNPTNNALDYQFFSETVNQNFKQSSKQLTPTIPDTPQLSLNRWYHVTYIQKGYTASVYINTILVSQLTGTILPYFGSYNMLSIGPLNGTVDDVKLFSKALDPYEIAENYNSIY